jgi:CDP-6-deoxy-D-xylo-4-hexulose-3-dehydrase
MNYKVRYGGSTCDDKELKAIISSVEESIISGGWQAGRQAALMEKEASKFLGVKHGILTTSGSCAGLLALSALELERGSEVIISATTFPTIFNIILQCGLVPVVVDAKIGTYNFDVDEVEKAITEKTKAIIAIHALGNPVDMPKLMKMVKGKDIKVMEDGCDAWGTTINGKPAMSFGDISITSFHAAHIVSMGVGGGVFTNDAKLAERVRQYRDWGRLANTSEPHKVKELPSDYNPRFVYDKIGYNFQILDLQAAMGRVQLKKAKRIKELRKKNFDYLYKHLSKFSDLCMPKWIDGADVCWFAFPITIWSDRRGELVAHLEKNGIETRSMFAGNITKHSAYKNSKFRISGELEQANAILENSFWLSCHPRNTKEDNDYIIKTFNDYFEGHNSDTSNK